MRITDWSPGEYQMDGLGRGRKAKGNTAGSRQAFMVWLKKTHPPVYAAAMRNVGMAGLGQATPATVETPSVWDKIVSTVQQVLPVYVTSRAQKAVLDAQLTRAKMGQPPLDTSQYAPTVRVETPGVEKAASKVQTYLIWGGVALAGVAGLFFLMPRRQRA